MYKNFPDSFFTIYMLFRFVSMDMIGLLPPLVDMEMRMKDFFAFVEMLVDQVYLFQEIEIGQDFPDVSVKCDAVFFGQNHSPFRYEGSKVEVVRRTYQRHSFFSQCVQDHHQPFLCARIKACSRLVHKED